MRAKLTAIVIGVALITIGVVLSGVSLGWWDADLLFDGWWTLFLIVPAAVSIIGNGPNVGNLVLLAIGLALLADAQKLLGTVSVWSLIGSLVIVAIGGSLIWKGLSGPRLPRDSAGKVTRPSSHLSAIFSGSAASFNGLPFKGAVTLALFGGVDLDLRGAVITDDVLIDATSIFGGTDIIVSPGMKVELASTGIFGGADKHADKPQAGAPGPVIHVRSWAAFGGLDIKVK